MSAYKEDYDDKSLIGPACDRNPDLMVRYKTPEEISSLVEPHLEQDVFSRAPTEIAIERLDEGQPMFELALVKTSEHLKIADSTSMVEKLADVLSKTGFVFKLIGKEKKKSLAAKLDQMQPDFFKMLSKTSMKKKKRCSMDLMKSFLKSLANPKMADRFSALDPLKLGEALRVWSNQSRRKSFQLEVDPSAVVTDVAEADLAGYVGPEVVAAPTRGIEFKDGHSDNNDDEDEDDDPELEANKDRGVNEKPKDNQDIQANDNLKIKIEPGLDESSATERLDMKSLEVESLKTKTPIVLLQRLAVPDVNKVVRMLEPNREAAITRPPVFNCEKCSLEFPSSDQLHLHNLLVHVNAKPDTTAAASELTTSGFRCSPCKLTFDVESKMRDHLNSVHGVTSAFACIVCSIAFSTARGMLLHIEVSHQPFKCKVCCKSFTEKRLLQDHVRAEHKGYDDGFGCNFCTRMFATAAFLERHVRNVHGSKPMSNREAASQALPSGPASPAEWSCNRCPAILPSSSELLQHNKERHQLKVCMANKPAPPQVVSFGTPQSIPIRVFKCEPCQKVFASQAFLDQHQRFAHVARPGAMVKITASSGPSIDPALANVQFFKCHKCPKYFIDQWSFDSHNKFEHSTPPELRIGNVVSLAVTKQRPTHSVTLLPPGANLSGSAGANIAMTDSKKRKSESSPEDPGSKRGKREGDEGAFECDICSKKFHHKGFYQKHKRVVHKITSFKPEVDPDVDMDVGEMTPSPRTLRSSARVAIAGTKPLPPSPPTQQSQQAKRPNTSVVMNILPRAKTDRPIEPQRPSFKCLTCNKSFGGSSELAKHAQTEHKPAPIKLEKLDKSGIVMSCGFCYKNFPGREEVVEHIRKDHRSAAVNSSASAVKQSPVEKEHHLQKQQQQQRPQNPRHQQKMLERPQQQHLQQQQRVVKPTKVSCTVCQKTYDNQQLLDGHMMANHRKGLVRNLPSIDTHVAGQKLTKPISNEPASKAAKLPKTTNGSMDSMDPLEILQRGLDEIDQVLQRGRTSASNQSQFSIIATSETPKSTRNKPAFPVKPNECIVIDL